MRIVHIIESLRSGGKERQLVELLTGLADRADVASEVVVMSDDLHYDIDAIPNAHLSSIIRRGQRDIGVWPRLGALLARLKPDVVHSWGTMCTVYGLPAAKLLGVPFVNGVVRDAPSGLTWMDKDYRRARLTFPLSDAVVGNSRAGLAAYRAPARRSHCIYNGFDLSRVARLRDPEVVREALGLRAPLIVGMVASLSHRKDHATFFAAAERILAERDDVAFLAIGEGALLETYRARYPPDRFPNIHLLGRRKDVEDIANLFSIGVLTTESQHHGEGLSNAIMEYMALGKPVVATDSGGNRELVEDGRTGILIGDRDVAALAVSLRRLLEAPELRSDLGRAGRARIVNDFARETMTAAYLDLYAALVARSKGSSLVFQ